MRRAPQLTLSHIKRLEEIADSAPDTRDRVTAGAVLLGLFSCARASDLARATSLDVDLGPPEAPTVWIQASVPHSKTAIAGRARLALPLLAPVVHFHRPWCFSLLRARADLHLPSKGPMPAGALIPSYKRDGSPAPDPLTSRQLSAFL